MTEVEFSELIETDIHWRVGQFASLKAIPIQYGMQPDHRNLVLVYSVPAIYSLWEGFIVTISHNFIKYINEYNVAVEDLHIAVFTHALHSEFKLNEGRIQLESQRKFAKEIRERLSQVKFTIPTKIQTESNVNPKVLNAILDCFNLNKIDSKFSAPLNKLLQYRNSIVHGENALTVDDNLIVEFTKAIEDLMSEIFLIFMDGIRNKSFLVHNPCT